MEDLELYEEEGMTIINIDALFQLEGEGMQADLQLGLDKVRVKKETLIEKLQVNLEKHGKEFKETHEAWRQEVILEMKKNLKAAQEGDKVRTHINLDEPTDHSEDYRRVISLLKASIDDTLVISAGEFRQYHDDEWRWSDHHKMAVQNYSASRLRD